MKRPFAVTAEQWRQRWCNGAAVGLLAGVLLAGGAYLAVYAASPKRIVDPRMERACSIPTKEGQFTGFAVIDGQLICWRM